MACAPHSKKNKLSGVTPSIATLWASKSAIEVLISPRTLIHAHFPHLKEPLQPLSSVWVLQNVPPTNHSAWALTHPWIEHRPVNDDFRCIPCMWAIENNRIPGFVDKNRLIGIKLVTTGWNDYRVGVQALDKHANGDAHKG